MSNVADKPLVAVIMGSRSDWESMLPAHEMLDRLGIPHECRVMSAHRTPELTFKYAAEAEARGIQVIIASAGGAAHLPGVVAALTHIPVLGVPAPSTAFAGVDSLLSIVQMPAGVPVGTLAVGKSGAINAAIFAAEILALTRPELLQKLRDYRAEVASRIAAETLP